MIVVGEEAEALVLAIRNGIVHEIELAFANDIYIEHCGNYYCVLNYVARYGKVSILTLLLKNEKLIKQIDLDTSLPIAAENGHTAVVELLLKNGANIDSMNSRGLTSLFLAVDYCHTEVVNILIRMGADTSVANEFQDTLLHRAVRNNSKEITLLLIDNGANKEIKNKDGATPLLIAVQSNYIDIVNILLEAGSNVNARDNFGNTSLHVACEKGILSTVKLLLDAGADINMQNASGWTPLIYACYFIPNVFGSLVELVELLLNRGADVSLTDNFRNTVLHVCVRNLNKNTPIIRLLLEHGAYVNSRNSEGYDVFHLAYKFGDNDFPKFLITFILYSNINTPKPKRYNGGNISRFWNACKSELELMETCKIAESNISYRQLLLERNNNKLTAYLSNPDIVSELDTLDYIQKYPIYAQYITEKINKGEFRLRLYYEADKVMNHISPLLPIVTKNIYNYLSNSDLANLIGWDESYNEFYSESARVNKY
ncbi:unnamed protein product [Diabrotica balteata]|uniref:Ankyrin repeat protein n=1 Tax=Diabrotica balteata TaxID=107213 RepID=A0A9N9XE22_DIABA|nr:unnamed protein product [Diabrotica balteata]